MEHTANSFLRNGLSAVAFYTLDGHEVTHAGTVLEPHGEEIDLNLPYPAKLIWHKGFVLSAAVDIVKEGHTIGKIVIQAALPETTKNIEVHNLGKSAELGLCAPLSRDMLCFHATMSHKTFKHMPLAINNNPLPMSYALKGQTGFIETTDYHGHTVVSAYTPVGTLGLAAVLKKDTSELYAPLLNQAKLVTPLLIISLTIGILLLHLLVTPLVRKLVKSEQLARDTNSRLLDRETHIRSILENLNEGIITISETGVIESFNPAAETMFGYKVDEVLGKNVKILMPESFRSLHETGMQNYLSKEHGDVSGVGREFTSLRKDGSVFPMEIRVTEMRLGDQRHFIGTLRDITQQKAAKAKIMHLATHDALTDLPNRNLLQDRLQHAIVQARRNQRLCAVLFIDLDNFKTINDSLGHHIGDALLKSVAKQLLECLREEDTVARQGGDEFIVVLDNLSSPEDSALAANKILTSLSQPYLIDGHELHSSASIGIAIYPHDGQDPDTLLKNSDTAMYHAKEAGRGNYQFFTLQMNAKAAERLSLETSLRRALEQEQLQLVYQPIVTLKNNIVVATEALLRWPHPELGYVSPNRFISIAEDCGLIAPLSEWVLRNACIQYKNWQEQGIQLKRMVVNLSQQQFRQKDLFRKFSYILSDTGVNPACLGLEITESVVMANPEVSIKTLNDFKQLGIELSLDDFGTGYSSLSALKRFPIDKLKIDQSFVRDIATDPDDEALVTAIIAMAHSLNLRVVAEGVKTEQQLTFIKQQQCDEYQGFYFSRPLPAEELYPKLISVNT